MDDKHITEGIAAAFLKDHRRDRRWRNIRFFITCFILFLFFTAVFFPSAFNFGASISKEPYVSLVRLSGTIESGKPFSAEQTIPMLVSAFDDENAKAVVLLINSGGGSAVQASIIYDRLVSLKTEHPDKPLLVVAEDYLASGAYLVALAADEIYVNPNTITGSIGVISKGFGFSEVMQKIGVQRRIFTAGSNKDRLDPFEPLTQEDTLKLKSVLDEVHDYFSGLVKIARANKLNGDPEVLFSGDFWTGAKAVELGLVDGTGNLADILKDKFDVERYRDYSVSESFVHEIARSIGVELETFTSPKLAYAQLS